MFYIWGMAISLKIPHLYDTTTAQVYVAPQYDGLLYRVSGANETPSFSDLRACSKHPIVKLALDLLTGELEGIPWRYELNAEVPQETAEKLQGVEQWIEVNINRVRDAILTQGIRNMLIYGFSPFEKIFDYNSRTRMWEIKQLKPLLHEYTWIIVDDEGNFDGFEQRMPHSKPLIRLNADESFIMSLDVQGQNWYGTSVLESTLPLWKQWCHINEQVEKFFDRCVGSRTALYYPVGKSPIGVDVDGNVIEMDNFEIAKQSIAAMEQNFGIVLPTATSRVVENTGSGDTAWRIETFSDTSGNVPIFIERQRQIEEMLVNSVGMPVRLFQEGRASGSRAELEAFTDISHTIIESRNHVQAKAIQEQIINPLTLMNFGIEHLVDIKVGNVKQTQLFFERHPSLDPNMQQQRMEQQIENGTEEPEDVQE
ncbi:hypothetical protein FACS1894189_3760 [Planctomycetales bacterium]|nr:hypothetical protein FACS1894189_3760 [Planctomycetales bacterium]